MLINFKLEYSITGRLNFRIYNNQSEAFLPTIYHVDLDTNGEGVFNTADYPELAALTAIEPFIKHDSLDIDYEYDNLRLNIISATEYYVRFNLYRGVTLKFIESGFDFTQNYFFNDLNINSNFINYRFNKCGTGDEYVIPPDHHFRILIGHDYIINDIKLYDLSNHDSFTDYYVLINPVTFNLSLTDSDIVELPLRHV